MAARRRVVWSPRARNSLDEALAFVAESSPGAALRILEQALAAADSLETLSERGRAIPESGGSPFREIFVLRYRLIYEVRPNTVRIVAFLREGQLRIVFFLEESPQELRSVVDFLNRQMERSEVLLVEARQYSRAGTTIVVPTLFG